MHQPIQGAGRQTERERLAEKAERLVWCHCEGRVREDGMCGDGFCSPEKLRGDCPVDRALIAEHR